MNDTVSGPSDTVTTPLNVGKRYTWRVRAALNGAFGPFSSTASFTAPAGGYNIAGELYDPLINGRTLGAVHGSVTFLPGVGIRLNERSSYVDYQLPATIDSGEISAVVTNISAAPGQAGLKTRIFSMSQGYANMTDNPRRFTIEKRNGAEAGAIAWRVITSGNQIETDSPQTRLVVNFSPSQSYLFRATWGGGRFNLTIDQVGGGRLNEMGKNYLARYNPTPHIAFLGSPDSTSGLDTQTVPGMVVRQFWVGTKTRPAAISNSHARDEKSSSSGSRVIHRLNGQRTLLLSSDLMRPVSSRDKNFARGAKESGGFRREISYDLCAADCKLALLSHKFRGDFACDRSLDRPASRPWWRWS